MQRHIIKAIAIFLVSLFFLIINGYDYAVASIEVENEYFKVTFKGKKVEERPVRDKFLFELLNKKINKRDEIELEIRAIEIKALKIYKEKLIIWGELRYGGDIISIMDLKENKIIDTLWSYQLAISSDSRYLVYIEHFPRSIPENTYIKRIVNIYDVNSAPEVNRIDRKYISDERFVGIPIYPEDNAQSKNLQFFIYDKNEENFIMSPFFFFDDDKKIIFFEWYKNKNYAIVVDISGGIVGSKILTKQVLTESMSEEFIESSVNESILVGDIKIEEYFVISTVKNYSKLKNNKIRIKKDQLVNFTTFGTIK